MLPITQANSLRPSSHSEADEECHGVENCSWSPSLFPSTNYLITSSKQCSHFISEDVS